MKAETLRAELVEDLVDFAWGQWSRLGVSAATPRDPEERAVDPEALLLLTFEVGRYEPRLLDEVLDWTALNEPLVSVQRLRNLCADDADRALTESALAWVARMRRRERQPTDQVSAKHGRLEPLFVSLSKPRGALDPAFARHGFARSPLDPSGKSQRPPLREPASFAFRLRRMLGLGARAEIMRALLTIRAPRLSGRVIGATAGFTQRNVREGLMALQDAGVVVAADVAGDRHYSVVRPEWASLLGFGSAPELPFHHDWIPNLRALTRFLRWLSRPDLDALTPYMRASEARTLVTSLDADLRYAGIVDGVLDKPGGDYWDEFIEIVRATAQHARKPRTT